jgi:8-oxo-dGTP pyrophosphatase MutT (NUDIX family)
MKKYVLVYCSSYEDKFILVEKSKPSWQKGKLNLPGGKIEEGETPKDAAYRELYEETGILPGSMRFMQEEGIFYGEDWLIYVFSCCGFTQDLQGEPDEPVAWYYPEHYVFDDPRLIPNLRLIIPLCTQPVSGWSIEEKDDKFIWNPGKGI